MAGETGTEQVHCHFGICRDRSQVPTPSQNLDTNWRPAFACAPFPTPSSIIFGGFGWKKRPIVVQSAAPTMLPWAVWAAYTCCCVAGAARGVPRAAAVLTSPTLQRLMPSVGNGFVGSHPIVGSDGGVHGAYLGHAIYMAGVYNGASKNRSEWGSNRRQSHRAAIPDWVTNVSAPSCGGARELGGYSLDMQRAVVTKAWSACGAALQVEEHHFAHQTRRGCLVHVVNATNHGSSALALRVDQFSGPKCGEASPPRGDGCDVRLALVACGPGRRCVSGSILESELTTVPLIRLAMASTAATPMTLSIAAGETKELVFIRSLSSTLDATSTTPLAAATTALESAEKAGAEQLLAEHVGGWSRLWDEGSIEVEGDADLAAAIDGSLYNILSSARADFPYGLSPGGLASDGYHGPYQATTLAVVFAMIHCSHAYIDMLCDAASLFRPRFLGPGDLDVATAQPPSPDARGQSSGLSVGQSSSLADGPQRARR
jgi:hypothetical protein